MHFLELCLKARNAPAYLDAVQLHIRSGQLELLTLQNLSACRSAPSLRVHQQPHDLKSECLMPCDARLRRRKDCPLLNTQILRCSKGMFRIFSPALRSEEHSRDAGLLEALCHAKVRNIN